MAEDERQPLFSIPLAEWIRSILGQSAVGEVSEYIRSQSEHHKRLSFQDEFRMFLKRYEVDFDEDYVWD